LPKRLDRPGVALEPGVHVGPGDALVSLHVFLEAALQASEQVFGFLRLHGSAFDLRNGFPLSLPAVEPVATYAVRVVGEGDDAAVEIDPTPIRARGAGPASFN
jgi:hypothetical protein